MDEVSREVEEFFAKLDPELRAKVALLRPDIVTRLASLENAESAARIAVGDVLFETIFTSFKRLNDDTEHRENELFLATAVDRSSVRQIGEALRCPTT